QGFAPDPPIFHGRKAVARRPDSRSEFLAVKIAFRSKSFERNVAGAIEFETHDVEIVAASGHRKIGGPPVPDPFKLDVAIDLELPDLIGPAAQRDIERRFL